MSAVAASLPEARILELRTELYRRAEIDREEFLAAGGTDLDWLDAPMPRHDAYATALGDEYRTLLSLDKDWLVVDPDQGKSPISTA
ncbi:hypothetical protein [Paludibaculum fermentans]|uniref:hypothetical protein n=1 Tax=Paludibaculum fermentans TaxID=1473598 RepID=UPI003EBC720B